jgi:CubicO group peptidase (beta-lactamase class C family)
MHNVSVPIGDLRSGSRVRGTGDGAEIDGHDVTVRQLPGHTSGLPDFAPGQGWRYDYVGFTLAGMFVERLSGKDIRTAVTDMVAAPRSAARTTTRRTCPNGTVPLST